ncbi:MAG: metallophosphoesterase [Hyphomonadaceae bacterium]
MDGIDFIGDIHGCSVQLERLLQTLGYVRRDGVWQHSERRVIFLGDFIDRGPEQRKTLEIVRPMVERGGASAVMGNHEFNAICYATPTRDGFVRPHIKKNRHQHEAFLAEYPFESSDHRDAISWFMTLPLYIDTAAFGVVHACWCEDSFRALGPHLRDTGRLSASALSLYEDKSSGVHKAIETILKGPEHPLPLAFAFTDKDGSPRSEARLKWWTSSDLAVSRRLEFGGARLSPGQLAELDLLTPPPAHPAPTKPVFVGHYWLRGEPGPLSERVVCVDYSVAKGGKLAAYRWTGEPVPVRENFVSVS